MLTVNRKWQRPIVVPYDKQVEAMGKDSSQREREDRFDTSKPHFRKPSSKLSKIVIDERFSAALTDSRFQLDIRDKYGRKSKKRNRALKAKEDLGAFYTIDDAKRGDDDKKDQEKNDEERGSNVTPQGDTVEVRRKESDDKAAVGHSDPTSRIAYLTALSRGELDVSSSSSPDDSNDSSNSSDSEPDSDGEREEGKAGVLDPTNRETIKLTNESSTFLAVMNMDWENVRAVDIFAILSSFVPPGSIRRVSVHPSDYGIKQMENDSMYGPANIWKKDRTKNSDKEPLQEYESNDDESSEGSDERDDGSAFDDPTNTDNVANSENDFDQEKLRDYEASKLKYYFAVVEFTKPEIADVAYKEVDSMEFEHSSAAIDLRSIPVDGINGVVKGRQIRDEALSVPSNYDPPDFVVNALQQSSVQCTWDMGDHGRELLLTKYGNGEKWGEFADRDNLKEYLASDNSSVEDSDDENAKAASMRKMLGFGQRQRQPSRQWRITRIRQ